MRIGGGGRMSFSEMNDLRRQKSVNYHKYREDRVKRDKLHTQNAINRMQQTASIFSIKENESFQSIGLIMQVAQKRAFDAADARQARLGQSLNTSA